MTTIEILLLTPADWARLTNLALCGLCFLFMAVDWRRFLEVERGRQMLRVAIAFFVAVTALGSWETLTDPDPAPGIRSYGYTIALCYVLVSIWWDRKDNPEKRAITWKKPCHRKLDDNSPQDPEEESHE